MANYDARFLTSPFAPADADVLRAWVAHFPDVMLSEWTTPYGALRMTLCGYASIPDIIVWADDPDAEPVEIDFEQELAARIAPDTWVTITEIGAEKLRDVTAYAVAINSKGERIALTLDRIECDAEAAFGPQFPSSSESAGAAPKPVIGCAS